MEAGVVNSSWAVVLPASSARAVAALRDVRGLEICEREGQVWLRGEAPDGPLRQRLLALPALERYTVAEDGAVTPWQHLVPVGRLPATGWIPLDEWAELSLPHAGWPGHKPEPVTLTLVRTGWELPAGALLVALEDWARFVEGAPQIRLEGLAFAANGERQAIVRGAELPPLPGVRLVDDRGILVPAGWAWQPAIDAAAVRTVFRLAEGEAALWRTSDAWQRIPADAWVKATRSAVRATARETGCFLAQEDGHV